MSDASIDRLIVDGYSLIHRHPESRELLGRNRDLACQRITRLLDECAGLMAARTTIVFDGRGRAAQPAPHDGPTEIIYAPAHLTADTVIERMVCNEADPARVRVVTSDRRERDTVTAAGAQAMSCGEFLDWAGRRRATPRTARGNKRGFTLGDHFPE